MVQNRGITVGTKNPNYWISATVTYLENDVLCVKWNIKLDLLTHSLVATA